MSEQIPTTGFLELKRTTSHTTERLVGAQSVKRCDVFAIVQRVTHVYVTELPLSFVPYEHGGCVNPDIYQPVICCAKPWSSVTGVVRSFTAKKQRNPQHFSSKPVVDDNAAGGSGSSCQHCVDSF